MHELGVVFHVIETVEDLAKENNASHIKRVALEIGEVTGILDDYLTDCWNWAVSKHEVMTECKLEISHIQAITTCNDCQKEYETVRFGKTCPYCKSENTVLKQGNEFIIKEIEITE